ncbi:MAG TPA: rRNA adenine N-6-methyltransferase family protein [Gemmatimonadales bacterium]|nr:rRNA adenine N-6-methyltransferase family protein [Gemmatimonadales bacterium]
MQTQRRPVPPGLLFGRTFLQHPRMLGSVVPSSRFLISRILRQVDWAGTRVVVEAGPGVGTVTTAILDRLGSEASLVAFEMNRTFVSHLRNEIPDPRLKVLHRSAAEAEIALAELGIGAADLLVSGIPLSGLTREARLDLLSGWRRVLRPGGVLVVYQFTRSALPDLRHVFGQVRQEFEPFNVLPARVFRCVT